MKNVRGYTRGVQGGKRVAVPLSFNQKLSRRLPPKHENDEGPVKFDRGEGNCANRDPDEMFTQGAEQNITKRICNGCPIKTECLAQALDDRVEFGVWGGMTERERRALLRRHPQVESWKKLFNRAKQNNAA